MKKSSFFIINHSDGKTGRIETLLSFLRSKGFVIDLLTHPLDNYVLLNTSYNSGDQATRYINRKKRGRFNLFEDFYISLRIMRKKQIDVFIGTSNFDTLPAIFLRLFFRKRIGTLVFYPSDYSEKRFKNKSLNSLYYLIENIAIKFSDLTISNSNKAEAIRISKHGLTKEKSLILPNPILVSNTKFIEKNIMKDHFIYVGGVSKEHGLSGLLNVIYPLIKKMVIIGTGNDLARSLKILRRRHIDVVSYGQKDHEFVVDYLRSFQGIGVAPYNTTEKWTIYSSPIKVGEYIASGLPAIVSDVPEVSERVKEAGLGIVYPANDMSGIEKELHNFDLADYHNKSKKYYTANSPPFLFGKLLVRINNRQK